MVEYERYAMLRDKANLNDNTVAKLSNMPASTLSDWKTGRATPKLEKLIKITTVLGVKLNDLIGADV